MKASTSSRALTVVLLVVLAACAPQLSPMLTATTSPTIEPTKSPQSANTAVVPKPTDTPLPLKPTETTQPKMTRIAIDGKLDDWVNYPILLTDKQGDTVKGGFDLKSVRAFTNDQYLYLMLDSYGSIGEYVQVDVDIDVNGDGNMDYLSTFKPRTGERGFGDFTSGKGVPQPFSGSSFAEGAVIEFRMPLSLIGNRESSSLRIRVMGGTCCQQDWYVIDNLGPVSVSRASERELTVGEKYKEWNSLPFTGAASKPFAIVDSTLSGARGLVLNQGETRAYIVGEFSGKLSRVDIDAASPAFGAATTIAENLFILNDVSINRAETFAYVTREAGPGNPPPGRNIVTRVDLKTGQAITVTAQLGQPTNIVLSQDETKGYVVDMPPGMLYRLDLATEVLTQLATGMGSPFAVVVDRTETFAYVTTEPARAGTYPKGDLLRVDLRTGEIAIVAAKAIYGASGITLSADEKLAFVTEFGPEESCGGQLSVVNIAPASADFAKKSVLLTGLCGLHDVRLNKSETLIYFVEVGAHRFSVMRINMVAIRGR